MRWRHTHEFEDPGDGRTRVIDRVDTPVPGAALRPMFVYRHRQLADDLAAHRLAAEHGLAPPTVADHRVVGPGRLGVDARSCAPAAIASSAGPRTPRGDDERQWNPDDPDPELLAGVDAVIHLAGASIAGRFTDGHRNAIRDSRIGPTRRLAEVSRRRTPATGGADLRFRDRLLRV